MEPTSIFEAATLRMAVSPVCACGHTTSFDPWGLWWHFKRRHWDDRLTSARHRFWCRVCGSRLRRKVRPKRFDLVKVSDANLVLPLPDEREWKRAVARVR